MKAIIVTGGSGFIGKHLVKYIEKETNGSVEILSISSSDLDLTDQCAVRDWCHKIKSKYQIEKIFHLAALYKAGGWPTYHPGTQFSANVLININTLNIWKDFFPSARMVSILSYCMYQDSIVLHEEKDLISAEPESYLFSYAFTKKVMVIGIKSYVQEFGMSGNCVVLPTVYGPGDSYAEDSHVIGALIGKFVRAKCAGNDEVEVWGDGFQRREFIYVRDAVEGIYKASFGGVPLIINVGTGSAVEIRKIVEIIKRTTGFIGNERFNCNKFVGALTRCMSNECAKVALGWEPKVAIEKGIAETVDDCLARLK